MAAINIILRNTIMMLTKLARSFVVGLSYPILRERDAFKRQRRLTAVLSCCCCFVIIVAPGTQRIRQRHNATHTAGRHDEENNEILFSVVII